MVNGIIGKKIGMTQLFLEDGTVEPATVLQAGPCVVVQAKRPERDGYEAVQLGLVSAKYKANKATSANGGLKWIMKGGGYYSECNKQLKG